MEEEEEGGGRGYHIALWFLGGSGEREEKPSASVNKEQAVEVVRLWLASVCELEALSFLLCL